MSRSDKRRAIRFFLYLRSVGRTPALQAANYFELAAMVSREYNELPHDVRRRSRWLGRKLIRAAGLIAACQAAPSEPPFNPQISRRPKCPTCIVKKHNKPKSIWLSREDAEAFCSCFRRYIPYPCPAGHGWHVTRLTRR